MHCHKTLKACKICNWNWYGNTDYCKLFFRLFWVLILVGFPFQVITNLVSLLHEHKKDTKTHVFLITYLVITYHVISQLSLWLLPQRSGPSLPELRCFVWFMSKPRLSPALSEDRGQIRRRANWSGQSNTQGSLIRYVPAIQWIM